MARIDKGNDLTADILQPGWTSTSDGFGLIIINATFKSDANTGTFAPFVRGTAFPAGGYTYCKSHKGSIIWDNLGIATLKVDYVGIDPTINSGNRTNANTSVANGLTAENITAHPNFFTAASGYGGSPLAGLPSDFGGAYDDSLIGPPVSVISQAPGPNYLKPVTVPSSEGYNGACFESGKGGRFIGFVDPDYPELYGKTQYLSRTTTYSGVIYTKNQSEVQALYALLGTATNSRAWGIFTLIPAWGPYGTGTFGNQNLLSQINVEEYGLLYKIMYEIRYSKEGWPPEVYQNV